MRRYLPKELRRRFDIAWRLVPSSFHAEIKRFIKTVKAVPTLQGVNVQCRDGTLRMSSEEGGGWFVADASSCPTIGYIFLHIDFQDGPEVPAILTILHELAHAVEYLEDDWKAESREDRDSEIAAWLQVGAWAARNLAHYDEAFAIVTMSREMADEEIQQKKQEYLVHSFAASFHKT
mgnify:CR=1 FL=1